MVYAPQSPLPAGRIEVASQAITTIAAQVVRQIPGVAGIASRTLQDGATQVVRWSEAQRGIDVQLNSGTVVIDVYIIVAYDARVVDVGREVQEQVRAAVAHALGGRTVQVNVRVQG